MSVRYEIDGRVATFTLDRPDQRNAVDPDLTAALGAALARFEADPDVWVGILTGAGPNFCAGADLKAIAAGRGAELSTVDGGFAGWVRFPRTKPVIAAVRGFALAGGTELVLATGCPPRKRCASGWSTTSSSPTTCSRPPASWPSGSAATPRSRCARASR